MDLNGKASDESGTKGERTDGPVPPRKGRSEVSGTLVHALLELELAGRVDRQPGNRVCLRAG